MTEPEMRACITSRVLSRFAGPGERRHQALCEVLGLVSPGLDREALAEAAARVPELPFSLYEKWVGLFADRLLETVDREHVEDLCRDTGESRATLLLLYSMFMESERMEKIVAEDLREK